MQRAGSRQRNAYLMSLSISISAHLLTIVFLAILFLPYAGRDGEQISVELSSVNDSDFSQIRMSARPEAASQDDSPDLVDSIDMDSQLADLLSGSNNSPNDQSKGKNGDRSGDGSQASFFGTTAYGDRFVYVIDMSGSMSGGRSRTQESRFKRAVAECLRSVDKLGPQQSFYVVLFSHQTRRMFDDSRAIPVMLPATAINKARLRRWLKDLSPRGGTDPREAVFVALQMQPSGIFLLSDGAFNGQKKKRHFSQMPGNPTVEEVVKKHNSAAAPIHTVAYEAPQTRARLKSLSERTKGEFQFVKPVGRTASNTVVSKASRQQKAARQAATKAAAMERMAKTWLARAEAAEAKGEMDRAVLRYRALIVRFPNTKYAKTARERIDAVGNGDLFGRSTR